MQTRFKAQSAMEYLMTYSWAVLIIAVVLVGLFKLGVFSGIYSGGSCIASSGFLCGSVAMLAGTAEGGNLSFTFGQSTGQTIYNVGIGCAAAKTTSGLPSTTTNANSIVYLGPTGAATWNSAAPPFNGVLAITSGSQVTVSGLKCFGTNANAIADPSIGTQFTGALFVNYTLNSGSPGSTNPMINAQFASVTLSTS